MTPHQPEAESPVSLRNQELRAIGAAFILPENIPDDFRFPVDFMDEVMVHPSTDGMTSGMKSVAWRMRALWNAMRSMAYEKALAAALSRTRLARVCTTVFAVVWCLGMFAANWSKVDQLKASVGGIAAVVPGLGGLASGAGTPEQARAAQLEALRRQMNE